MRSPPSLFVSFTKRGGDGDFARRLIDRLQTQPVTVWVYEDEAGEIPGGTRIAGQLKQRIAACDVFVPVVSPNSFESEYTRQEVDFAIARRASGQAPLIVPLVSRQVLSNWQGAWPGAYQQLSDLRFRTVDFSSRASLDEAVVGLCSDLGVEYHPPLREDPRLPFLDRFVTEVRDKCPRRDEHEIGIYRRLMVILSRFAEELKNEQYAKAGWLMRYFCMMCEYEFPDEAFYYPYVVGGVCDILSGDLDSAESLFRGLLENPLVDETTFGALGYLAHQRGEYRSALLHYRKAKELYPTDPAAKVGIIVNALVCGDSVDAEIEELELDIEQGRVLVEEDINRVHAARAFSLATAGKISEALALFEELVASGRVEDATILQFARALARQRELDNAIRLLRRLADKAANHVVLHQLALYTAIRGDLKQAANQFDELIRLCPTNRQYRIDFAQILWRSHKYTAAKAVCAPMLDSTSFPPPHSTNDFFLDGFANWISGEEERAGYDFARSQFPPEKHYRHLLPTAGRSNVPRAGGI